jgi:hypothetical protein
MKSSRLNFFSAFWALALCALLASCGAYHKAQAARILRDCRFTLHHAEIDSVAAGSLHFTVALAVENPSPDTLFVRSLSAVLSLDTLASFPLSLRAPAAIGGGDSQVFLSSSLPLSPQVFRLFDAQGFRLAGKAGVAFEASGDATELDFDEEKPITAAQKEKFKEQAKKFVLNSVLNPVLNLIERRSRRSRLRQTVCRPRAWGARGWRRKANPMFSWHS